MKTKANLILTLMILGISSVFAQDVKTEKFKVYGNCGMCESRIEKAVKALDGVSAADWDKETKMIEVSFDAEKLDLNDIHNAIAKAGHDTDIAKADVKVYDALPGCCQYDRNTSIEENKGHDGHKH